jgi:Domain of unknown function (DUF4214)
MRFRPNPDALEDRRLLSFGGGNIDYNLPRVNSTSPQLNFTSNSFHNINATVPAVASAIVKDSASADAQLTTYVTHIPFGETSLLPILEADVTTFENGGTVTPAPTFTTVQANTTITTLITDLLDRAPDSAELTDGTQALQSGVTVQMVANVIVQSNEFLTANTTTGATADANNTQFVTALYNDVLGRAPDSAGLASWVSQLDANTLTTDQVANSFIVSSEAATSSTSILQVAAIPFTTTTSTGTKYYFGTVVPDGTITGNFPGTSQTVQLENLIQQDTLAYLANGIGVTFNILKSNVGWASDNLLTFNGHV